MDNHWSSEAAPLRDALRSVKPGPVDSARAGRVLSARAACWHLADGGDEEAMGARKVKRAESVQWAPPLLSFIMERHGGTVRGSTRASVQRWTLNVDTGAATVETVGRRQLRPMAKRLSVVGIADDIAKHVLAQGDHPALTVGCRRARRSSGRDVPGPGRRLQARRWRAVENASVMRSARAYPAGGKSARTGGSASRVRAVNARVAAQRRAKQLRHRAPLAPEQAAAVATN